ncbi:MAG: class I SAM-dependent methyltransferase [Methanoregula sp.]
MSLPELLWLYRQAKQFKTIVEIGCWKGKSTHALLTGALKNGGQVTVVDHFQGAKGQEWFFKEVAYRDMYHVFMSNLGHLPNLEVLKMSSVEGAQHIDSAEMVFIDAGHDYEDIKADLDAWEGKATRMLCGHDYQFPGVKKAVMERFGVPMVIDTIWYVEV